MSALAAALDAIEAKPIGGVKLTRIEEILAKMDDEDANAFRRALTDPAGDGSRTKWGPRYRIPAIDLSRLLKAYDFSIHEQSIQRYRKDHLPELPPVEPGEPE